MGELQPGAFLIQKDVRGKKTYGKEEGTQPPTHSLFPFDSAFRSEKRKSQLLSHVQLFATPWTVACQAPLSIMEWITIFFKLQTKILKGKMIFFLLMDAIMLDNTIIIEKI